MLIAVLKKQIYCVICYDFRHIFAPCTAQTHDGASDTEPFANYSVNSRVEVLVFRTN